MNAVEALDAFRRAVEEQLRGHVARERYLNWRLEMAESRIATLEAEVRRLARREAA